MVYFDSLDINGGKFDYKIRMNYSLVPTTRSIAKRFFLGIGPWQRAAVEASWFCCSDTTYQRYFFSGFLSIQNLIDTYLLRTTRPNATLAALPHLGQNEEISNEKNAEEEKQLTHPFFSSDFASLQRNLERAKIATIKQRATSPDFAPPINNAVYGTRDLFRFNDDDAHLCS